jgi:hypothetical protein
MAPANFFYSHSYSRQYAVPMTLTGAVASYDIVGRLRGVVGGTLGWNSWDSARDQWGVLAGLTWTSCDCGTAVDWYIHTGDDVPPNVNYPGYTSRQPDAERVSVTSLVIRHQITHDMKYVFQGDFGTEQNGAFSGGTLNRAKWYGISQYLLMDWSDCLSWGLRFEWFRDPDHSRILDLVGLPVEGSNYYGLTLGANWRPWCKVVVRPELRYDWSDASLPLFNVGGPYDAFSQDHQLTAAVDVVLRF